MGKPFAVVALTVFAFCFSSALSLAPSAENFSVVGQIYCDPCRLEFVTRLSRSLQGVKVSLECKKPDTDELTYSVEGVTDANGVYSLAVEGDHEDEICSVRTNESTHPDCSEHMTTRDSDRIVLTKNMGVSSMTRYVNPLGFMTEKADAKCAEVVKELALDNDDDLPPLP